MEVSQSDIPNELVESFKEKASQAILDLQTPNNARHYMKVKAYTEDNFLTNKGVDLIDSELPECVSFKVLKSDTYAVALRKIAEQLKEMVPSVDYIRLWPFVKRCNLSYRPTHVQNEGLSCEKLLDRVGDDEGTVFMQISKLPIVLKSGK